MMRTLILAATVVAHPTSLASVSPPSLSECYASVVALRHDAVAKKVGSDSVFVVAKHCLAAVNIKTVPTAQRYMLGTLAAEAGDYAASPTAYEAYGYDRAIPVDVRGPNLHDALPTLEANGTDPEARRTLETLMAIADSIKFVRLQLNTRMTLARLYRAEPERHAMSYRLVRDLVMMAERDPDTTKKAGRAVPIAQLVQSVATWGVDDRAAAVSLDIIAEATRAFGSLPGFMDALLSQTRAAAIVGTSAQPLRAAQWFNAKPGTTEMAFGDGKVYLIEFTAHWCGPCKQTYEPVQAMYEKYHERGFEVIFATQFYGYYEAAADMPATAELDSLRQYFLRDHKIPFPIAVAGDVTAPGTPAAIERQEQLNTNFANYYVKGMPTFALIGRDGRIIKMWSGWGAEVQSDIANEVAKAAGSTGG